MKQKVKVASLFGDCRTSYTIVMLMQHFNAVYERHLVQQYQKGFIQDSCKWTMWQKQSTPSLVPVNGCLQQIGCKFNLWHTMYKVVILRLEPTTSRLAGWVWSAELEEYASHSTIFKLCTGIYIPSTRPTYFYLCQQRVLTSKTSYACFYILKTCLVQQVPAVEDIVSSNL